jgi:hypothetical protein
VYNRIVIAIILLAHPALGQTLFEHLKRPMILVSYCSIDSLSSSIAKKLKERLSSFNRRLTLLCNAGYIDHDLSKSCAFDFGLLRDLGALCNFGFEDDMLNNLGLASVRAHHDRARGWG